MGTRYQDQPAEHWAGPESLDPTPVWKQYVLIALLLVVALVVVIGGAFAALAPTLVTPPALVFGDRLVLSASDVPAVDAPAKLVGPPIVDGGRGFYLLQPEKGRVLALRIHWIPRPGGPDCAVADLSAEVSSLRRAVAASGGDPNRSVASVTGFIARCPGGVSWAFDLSGRPATSGGIPTPPRGLDQYLVSVSGDRTIVNLSRIIESSERTSGPVPTGIPQPQQP